MTRQTVTDEGSGRKYWTQTPNIVLDLGLRPFPLALYVQLKRITGDGGQSDETTRQLAVRMGCSAMAISKALAELAIPRPELNGKALVSIAQVNDGKGTRKARNLIALIDVWPENMARYGSGTVHTVDGAVNYVYGTVNTVDGSRKHSVHPKEPVKNGKNEEPLRATSNGDVGADPHPVPNASPVRPTAPKPRRQPSPLTPPELALRDAILAACGWGWDVLAQANRVNVTRLSRTLAAAGRTPADVAAGRAWYARNDWRGRKGQAPGVADLETAIGSASAKPDMSTRSDALRGALAEVARQAATPQPQTADCPF